MTRRLGGNSGRSGGRRRFKSELLHDDWRSVDSVLVLNITYRDLLRRVESVYKQEIRTTTRLMSTLTSYILEYAPVYQADEAEQMETFWFV